jgi:hypothetical protein
MGDLRIPATHGAGHGPPLARWCDKHQRWECVHQRVRGRGPCHGQAITGTDACPAHAGKSVERARRDAVSAWAAVPGDDGISPGAAVLGQLGLAWRRAELLGAELERQAMSGGRDRPGHERRGAGGTAGSLVGETFSASAAAGGIYATGERVRGLAELEAAERDRVVRFAEVAHRMGIEEARIDLAKEIGHHAVTVLSGVLARLGLDSRDFDVQTAVYAELRQITGEGR